MSFGIHYNCNKSFSSNKKCTRNSAFYSRLTVHVCFVQVISRSWQMTCDHELQHHLYRIRARQSWSFELAHMYFMLSFLCVFTREVLCRYRTKGHIMVLYTNSQYTYVIISLQFLTHQIQEWNQTVRTSIKNRSHIVTQSTSIITQCEYDKALSISTKPCTKGKYWMITTYNITV